MSKAKTINHKNSFDYTNAVFMTLMSIITIFPFYYVIIVSLADYESITKASVYLFPTSFNFDSYKYIFDANYITSSLLVSTFVTVAGTLLSLLLSVAVAYPLSKKEIPGRNSVFSFIIFPMFFSGGLIPYYLTVKNLGMIDSISVLIVPMAISSFNVIILKNYFETIPASLEESAKVDGANDMYILWKIILPTSLPILATISLFYAVDRWNEWWHAMLFISSKDKMPLQMLLREVLFNIDQAMGSALGKSIQQSKGLTYSRSVQMATVVIATIPIVCVYPFLQKYFTKGIMIGAVKE